MHPQTFEWQYIYWTFSLEMDVPAITRHFKKKKILIFSIFLRFNLQPALFFILLCHIYFTASLASAICHTSSFIPCRSNSLSNSQFYQKPCFFFFLVWKDNGVGLKTHGLISNCTVCFLTFLEDAQ